MGCDIHFFVEVKDENGKWKTADVWVDDKCYPHVDDPFYEGRNYNLFAILAGIRVPSIDPISKRKGIPDDACDEYLNMCEDWQGDGHSHSYYTVKELKEFDWNKKATLNAFVNASGYLEYLRLMFPTSYCGDVYGAGIRKVSNEEMIDAIKTGKTKDVYTNLIWTESYKDMAGSFYSETIPKMEALGDPDSVRCVFFFDN